MENKMNKKDIMTMLKQRIGTCYEDLLYARSHKFKELYIEGFRNRLDELILMYHRIQNISFMEACKKLLVNYKDVDSKSREVKEDNDTK